MTPKTTQLPPQDFCRRARYVLCMGPSAALALSLVLVTGCRSRAKEEPLGARSTATSGASAAARDAAVPRRASMTDTLEAARTRARVPGLAVASVVDGSVRRCEAVGLANVDPARPVAPETVFHAASLGKPIVAALVMKHVESGRVQLDEDVSRFLPFPIVHPLHPSRPLTLRMLLTHSASIHDRLDWLGRVSAPGDPPMGLSPFLGAYLARRELPSFLPGAPGTHVEYSNVGTALAALVVENITNEPFDVVARREVFGPLRMKAAFRSSQFEPGSIATPHVARGAKLEPRPLLGRAVYPASDLRTSACDLGRFLAAMVRGGELEGVRILGGVATREMLSRNRLPSGEDVALGWQVVDVGGRTFVGHEGEDDGASAAMFLDVTRRRAAVVLANGDAFSSGDVVRARALSDLLTRLLED